LSPADRVRAVSRGGQAMRNPNPQISRPVFTLQVRRGSGC